MSRQKQIGATMVDSVTLHVTCKMSLTTRMSIVPDPEMKWQDRIGSTTKSTGNEYVVLYVSIPVPVRTIPGSSHAVEKILDSGKHPCRLIK